MDHEMSEGRSGELELKFAVDALLTGKRGFQQSAKFGDVPRAVQETIQSLPAKLYLSQMECFSERGACRNDGEVAVQQQQG